MATPTSPPMDPPAGWYSDPDRPGRRYWDGHDWADQFGPPDTESPVQAVTTAKPKDPRNDTLAAFGYILAVLMPIVGAIIAIPLYSRGDRRATSVLLTSVVAFIIWFLIAMSSASSGTEVSGGGYY